MERANGTGKWNGQMERANGTDKRNGRTAIIIKKYLEILYLYYIYISDNVFYLYKRTCI